MSRTTTFQTHLVYELTHGPSKVLIAPQCGARLLNWYVGEKEVIHWPDSADWGKVESVRGGNPILFPFIARHMVNGEIGWWLNAVGKKRAMPMHGFARSMPFAVIAENDSNSIRMRLEPNPQTIEWYPFEFIFDVVYTLKDTELEVALEVTNTGIDPMPYYMGHHFYFAVPHAERAKWDVTIPCERTGRQNPDGSITEQPAPNPVTSLSEPSLSDQFHIGMKASEISLREQGTGKGVTFNLKAGGNVDCYAVTTWTQEASSDFYCVEPWTGLPNAIHHGKGLRYLLPGAKERFVCVLKAQG